MLQSQIRNFSIISHVDHGKSSLADRLLELTETVDKRKMKPQFLDMMDLEREKGITIKMQPVRMKWKLPESLKKTFNFEFLILNLIDTPGHVDFSYEVSRSLAAVEGAVLLVDAVKGIQAQTLANLDLAKEQNLAIIPAINKIDLKNARTEEVNQELANILNIDKKEVIRISAKYGINIEEILEAIIKKIPCPTGSPQKPLRALIFDSKYDSYKGVIAYIRIIDGSLKAEDEVYLMRAQIKGKAKEIGYFSPEFLPQKELLTGEVGYIATGIKEPGAVKVGDTIISSKFKDQSSKFKNEKSKVIEIKPLQGYQEPKPVVFASIYPQNPDDFDILKEALVKLKLNEPSLTFELQSKEGLGRGFLCGFLGSLHAEIIIERLFREYGLNLIISAPNVVYKIIDKFNKEIFIKSASEWPDLSKIKETQEPWACLEVITPISSLGKVLEILERLGGNHIETKYLNPEKSILIYEIPLREIISGFYDKLKGVTQGYGSMSYKILEYRSQDLVKLEVLIAGKKEEIFSKIVKKEEAFKQGQKIVKKLKEILPPQQFSVAIQAVVEGRVIARETIKARRKDVTAPLYGGDVTRKRKLLEKQKKGKKQLKEKGQVRIPSEVYLKMLK